MAIAHLGSTKWIDDIETERSPAARACNLFYMTALRATFRDFDHPFSSKYVTLELLTEDEVDDEHPTEEYRYAYRYPSTALRFRRILNPGGRNLTKSQKPVYKIISDEGEEVEAEAAASGCRILTDLKDAKAEISIIRADVERYPDDFKLAFTRRLASYIAPMVTGGDPFKMQQSNFALYRMELQKAEANAGNEESVDEVPDADHLQARN